MLRIDIGPITHSSIVEENNCVTDFRISIQLTSEIKCKGMKGGCKIVLSTNPRGEKQNRIRITKV